MGVVFSQVNFRGTLKKSLDREQRERGKNGADVKTTTRPDTVSPLVSSLLQPKGGIGEKKTARKPAFVCLLLLLLFRLLPRASLGPSSKIQATLRQKYQDFFSPFPLLPPFYFFHVLPCVYSSDERGEDDAAATISTRISALLSPCYTQCQTRCAKRPAHERNSEIRKETLLCGSERVLASTKETPWKFDCDRGLE